jgi:hypothetical protein
LLGVELFGWRPLFLIPHIRVDLILILVLILIATSRIFIPLIGTPSKRPDELGRLALIPSLEPASGRRIIILIIQGGHVSLEPIITVVDHGTVLTSSSDSLAGTQAHRLLLFIHSV